MIDLVLFNTSITLDKYIDGLMVNAVFIPLGTPSSVNKLLNTLYQPVNFWFVQHITYSYLNPTIKLSSIVCTIFSITFSLLIIPLFVAGMVDVILFAFR